jgi:predicted 3-demethylubiquinone-9 3-methyltransferase (glyoxalase superfamily)
MNSKISPCLSFDGQAEEAALFYTAIFPDSRIVEIRRWGETGPGVAGSVLVVYFQLAGKDFLALNGGPQYHFTPAISLTVDCKDQAEVDAMWAKLLDGGEPARCGWLTDRYGVSWQITPEALPRLLGDPDPAVAARVMRAMMGMVKIDVAEIERAAAGDAT